MILKMLKNPTFSLSNQKCTFKKDHIFIILHLKPCSVSGGSTDLPFLYLFS
ncbi:hypothetical protein E2C01_082980 [Portunus trituberculatus]|uniref:Uncharacterized protein n=1 Tax=Portunus trituberculatus TaxID=210409 RepID=A0A5B7ITQ0_PORTR|nr:hypothetical protein [Portunus trituberculatus]